VTLAPVTRAPVTPAPVTPFPTFTSSIEYSKDPKQKWTVQLPGTGSAFDSKIGEGNAVTVSPDGSSVYVTLDDGRLEVLVASDGSNRWGYKPSPVADGWGVACRSGVSFGEMPSLKYAVYAIIDIPPVSDMDYQS
jgi:hypothetical protein